MTSEATVPEAAVRAIASVINPQALRPRLPGHERGQCAQCDGEEEAALETGRAALTAALPHLSTAIHDAALALEPALEAANALAPMELTEAEAEVWRRGYSTAADWCVAALKGKSIPAPANAALEEETRFLIERLDELEQTISSGEAAEEIYREFNGHITPSIARLRSALKSIPAPAATHRHKKRGTEYVLLDYGRMQAKGWYERRLGEDRDTWVRVPVDMREVTIYRSVDDGLLWARPREEFEDGRFEAIIPAPAEGNEAEGAKPIGYVNSRAIADNRHGASAVMSFTNGAGFVIPVYAGPPPSAAPAQAPGELASMVAAEIMGNDHLRHLLDEQQQDEVHADIQTAVSRAGQRLRRWLLVG